MKQILPIALLLLFLLGIGQNKLNAQNKSLEFNGTSSKVVIPDHDDLNFTEQFTIEAWIYANQWKSQAWQGSVVNKDYEFSGIQGGYMIRIGAGGRMEGIITPGWKGVSTGPIMKEKTWNHVAMVFSKGEMWLYINGNMEAYKGGFPEKINVSSADLLIGESPGFAGRVWNGRIDEVRLWNVVRTAEEIKQNMGLALNGDENGLVAYYTFDEEDASKKLNDKTNNGHDGTLEGFASNVWVEGYQPAENDVAVNQIINPCDNPSWTNAEQIQIEVQNTAFNSVSNFDVSFEYKGKKYTETVTDTLAPWQTHVHCFNSFIDLEYKDKATIKAYVEWDADNNADNNSIVQTFERKSTIRMMDAVQHNFGAQGQLHSNIVTLPDNNLKYEKILLHVSVDCPAGGCDPWDQPANIKIKKDGKEYEIGRFITPYKKACGPWTIDVTDFRSILKGQVELVSYIQVWGGSGWLLTIDLEFVEGVANNKYSKLVPLYEIDGVVYGDPNKSYDLDEQIIEIPENVSQAHIRMTNTGHGQANTNNAAEFMEANHKVWINGVEKFNHHLWKDDCDQNPCSPQSGTWKYARAGWCPGQDVIPEWYDISTDITPGETVKIDYVLQEYTNQLNSGYNGGSHTEPFYRIYSYLVLLSDAPFGNYTDLLIDSINLMEGSTEGTKKLYLEFYNNGNTIIENANFGYVVNNAAGATEAVEINLAPGESTTYEFEIADFDESEPGLVSAFGNVANDAVKSNNAKAVGFGGYTFVDEKLVREQVKIFPNPVNDKINIASEVNIKNIKVLAIDGKVVKHIVPVSNNCFVDVSTLEPSIYYAQIELLNNVTISQKIVKN